jgi:hypothetical protein
MRFEWLEMNGAGMVLQKALGSWLCRLHPSARHTFLDFTALVIQAVWQTRCTSARLLKPLSSEQPHMSMQIVRDASLGLRLLWRQPSFTAVALLALGLGVAATTAIFTIV